LTKSSFIKELIVRSNFIAPMVANKSHNNKNNSNWSYTIPITAVLFYT